MDRLNAIALTGNEKPDADTVLLVGVGFDAEKGQKVISINPASDNADCYFVLPDPLQTDGLMLNRDGSLCVIRAILPKEDKVLDCHALLARLAGQESLAGLGELRRELADEIGELSVITEIDYGRRLFSSDLEPVLKSVGTDNREKAFADHLENIGMYQQRCECAADGIVT